MQLLLVIFIMKLRNLYKVGDKGIPYYTPEQIDDILIRRIATHGFNFNKTYQGKPLPKWTDKDFQQITDANERIAEIMPFSDKKLVGGTTDIILPYQNVIILPGQSKSYKDKVTTQGLLINFECANSWSE